MSNESFYYTDPRTAGPGYAGHVPHPGQGAAYPAGYHAAQYQGAYPSLQYQSQPPFLNLGSDRFLKGLLIGAAAAYVLTNESVQRSAIKGMVRIWSVLQGGVEEIKERFHDAEAEIHAAEATHGE